MANFNSTEVKGRIIAALSSLTLDDLTEVRQAMDAEAAKRLKAITDKQKNPKKPNISREDL